MFVTKEQWSEYFPETISNPLNSAAEEYLVYYQLMKSGQNVNVEVPDNYDKGEILYCNLRGLVEKEFIFQHFFRGIQASERTYDYFSAVFRSPFTGEVIRDAVYEIRRDFRLVANWREIRAGLEVKIKNLEKNWIGIATLPRGETRIWMKASYDRYNDTYWKEKKRTYFDPAFPNESVEYARNSDDELVSQGVYPTDKECEKKFLLPTNLGLAGQIRF